MATGHIPQIFFRITVQNQIRVAQRVVIDSALRYFYSCDLCDTSFLIRFRTHSRLEQAGIIIPEENKNPNPSPIEKRFGFSWFGAMEGTRTPGLLIRSQSLYPAELPTHTFRSEHDVFYHRTGVLSTLFRKYF